MCIFCSICFYIKPLIIGKCIKRVPFVWIWSELIVVNLFNPSLIQKSQPFFRLTHKRHSQIKDRCVSFTDYSLERFMTFRTFKNVAQQQIAFVKKAEKYALFIYNTISACVWLCIQHCFSANQINEDRIKWIFFRFIHSCRCIEKILHLFYPSLIHFPTVGISWHNRHTESPFFPCLYSFLSYRFFFAE